MNAANDRSRSDNPWSARVEAADWTGLTEEVNDYGCALMPALLTPGECADFAAMYDEPKRFRSTVDMARYRFGKGEYRYFDRPFPEALEALKQALYPRLLPIARDWWNKLGRADPAIDSDPNPGSNPESNSGLNCGSNSGTRGSIGWPDSLDEWLRLCHDAGQTKSTPILLRYRQGDWNALHRDLYGDLVFPLQVVINLSAPGIDHTGGEFLMVEQRPRAQSRGTATLIPQGYGLIFTTRDRPVESARGWSAAPVRHGVSVIRSGERFTLGLVFHDAS